MQLFQAVAPLAAPPVTRLTISLEGQLELELGCVEVQALASSIGGSLRTLILGNCTLLSTFWEDLAHHFPELASIVLLLQIETSALDIAGYLSARSSSSSQPMCLRVYNGALDEKSQQLLEEHISHHQLHNITLEVVNPPDYCQYWHSPSGETGVGEEDG
jgi:hypothetical protein